VTNAGQNGHVTAVPPSCGRSRNAQVVALSA
jgi:hypothetical protein